jgi:hypothetical protein
MRELALLCKSVRDLIHRRLIIGIGEDLLFLYLIAHEFHEKKKGGARDF